MAFVDSFLDGLPLKAGVEKRDYQVNAAARILEKGNSLVVMPTALGKTFVAILVMAGLLQRDASSRFLFLAPTKPLVIQQARRIGELLDLGGREVAVVTGEIPPEKRKQVYSSAAVVCATPQCVANDLAFAGVGAFSLVVFDECHRAVGEYAYVEVAKEALARGVRVLGLTASPSSDRKKIDEIRNNLGIEHVEIKTEDDADVRHYIQDVAVDWQFVNLPMEFLSIKAQLNELLIEAVEVIRRLGIPVARASSRTELLELRPKLLNLLKTGDVRAYSALSAQARALNLAHAIDLLEAEGVGSLRSFIDRLHARKADSKAVRALAADPRVAKIRAQAAGLEARKIEHPKFAKLREIVSSAVAEGKSVIVFAHYRDTVKQIVGELNLINGADARQLIGRSGEGGMKQKEQGALVDSFRAREFNVLVASSVGEEGLDIPAVDLVVFFEAVPSEIRAIQRRGRAGRVKAGRVIVLIAKGTRDEAYHWSSRAKEGRMKRVLGSLGGQGRMPGGAGLSRWQSP